jgi:hypothetical protein
VFQADGGQPFGLVDDQQFGVVLAGRLAEGAGTAAQVLVDADVDPAGRW